MQSLLQGLPLAAQSYTYQQPTGLSQFRQSIGGVQKLYDAIFGGNTTAPPTSEEVIQGLKDEYEVITPGMEMEE